MAFFGQNAEGGTNGTTVSAGNSGGTGQTAVTGISATGTSTLKYDNTVSAHGLLSFLFGLTSGNTTFLTWTITATGALAMRVNLMFDTLPSVAMRVIDIRTGTATVIRLQLTAANLLQLQEGGTGTPVVFTTASAITAATWYRFEINITSIGAGTAHYTYALYTAGADSMTTLNAGTVTTGQLGTTNISVLDVGSNTAAAYTGNIHADDIAWDPTGPGFIGPVFKSASCSDTAGATDSAKATQMALHAVASDTAHATDAVTQSGMNLHAVAVDTAHATDAAVASGIQQVRSTADTAGATDVATRGNLIAARAVSDTAAATDATTRGALIHARSAADTAAATDVATRLMVLARSCSDTAGASDAIGVVYVPNVAFHAVGALVASSAGTVSPAYPAVNPGDAIMMVLQHLTAGASYPSPPAGWRTLAQVTLGTGLPSLVLLAKNGRATGSESGTVAVTAAAGWNACILTLTNVRASGDIHTAITTAVGGSSTTVWVGPAAIAVSGNSGTRLLVGIGTNVNGLTWTGPAATGLGAPAVVTSRLISGALGIASYTTPTPGSSSALIEWVSATGDGGNVGIIFDVGEIGLPMSVTTSDTAGASDVATRGVFSPTRTASDTAGATDVATRALVKARTSSDSAGATDVAVPSHTLARTSSDTAHATDVATRGAMTFARSTSDTAHATDVATIAGAGNVSASDTAHATDVATRAAMAKSRTASDIAAATDVATRSVSITRGPPDSAGATDTATRTMAKVRTASDTARATDFVFGTTPTVVNVSIVDEVLIRDTDQVQLVEYFLTASDTAHATDAVSSAFLPGTVHTADSAPATDVATIKSIRLAVDAVDNAHAIDVATTGAYRWTRSAADTAHASDVATATGRVMFRSTSDTAHATDSVASVRAPMARTASDTAHATDVATRTSKLATSTADSAPATDTNRVALVLHANATDSAPAVDGLAHRASVGVSAHDFAPAVDSAGPTASVNVWRVRAGRPTTTWQAGPVSTSNLRLILADS